LLQHPYLRQVESNCQQLHILIIHNA
jgi:hypothetical protein